LLLDGQLINDLIIGDGNMLIFDSITDLGVYTLLATNSMGCQQLMPDSIVVDLYPSPIVIAQATPATICVGSSSNLSATGAVSYLWSEGSIVSPNISTTYTVIGISTDGCTDTSSVEVNVTSINQPVIAYENGVLSLANQYDSYIWLNCVTNEVYSNQVENVFTPVENGIYSVVASISSCSDTSNCIEINDLYLSESEANQNIIFPNPVKDVLFFTLKSESINYSITSMDGRTVQSGIANDNQINLLDNLTTGTYVLLLIQNNEMFRTVFVKD